MADRSILDIVDVTNCDKEPVQAIGSVQPHGFLIAFDAVKLSVLAASENISELLDCPAAALLNKPATDVLPPLLSGPVTDFMNGVTEALAFEFALEGKGVFYVFPYWTNDAFIVELEPVIDRIGVDEAILKANAAIPRLRAFNDFASLSNEFARLVYEVLGFDLTMVYQFDNEFNGSVIAERAAKGVDRSFLGLTFPASDIPPHVRALFLRNRVRAISRVSEDVAAITPRLNPLNGEPFDLSDSGIRSVSPIHIEYLRNMGVKASFSISLIAQGELWGLISCHHYSDERCVSPHVKTACILLCEAFSQRVAELQAMTSGESLTRKLRAVSALHDSLLPEAPADPKGLLDNTGADILHLLEADGVILDINDVRAQFGAVPPIKSLDEIVEACVAKCRQLGKRTFATHNLGDLDLLPTKGCAGLLFHLLRGEKDFVIAFRRERVREVTWAGDPDNKVFADRVTKRLHPRRSFETFQKMQVGRSEPWENDVITIAPDLGATLQKVLTVASQREALSKALTLQRRVARVEKKAARDMAALNDANWQLTERLRLAAGAGRVGVWDWDVKHEVIYLDELMLEHFDLGGAENEMPYEKFRSAVFPQDVALIDAEADRALTNGGEFNPEFRVRRTDGEIRYLESRGVVQRDDESGSLRIVGVCWDKTEDRKNKEVLEQLIHDLHVTNEELEGFAYHASHDLKAPLRAIHNLAEILIEDSGDSLDVEGRENLDLIKGRSERAMKMVRELLILSRAGKVGDKVTETNLGKIVEEAFYMINSGDGFTLEHDLSEQSIYTEESALSQVLVNLFGNAIKHHDKEEGVVTVSADDKGNGWFSVSVSDDGPGIDPRSHKRIFEPFVTLRAKDDFEATGMGLAIVGKSIEKRGGEINVDSDPSTRRGTRFEFTWPVTLVESENKEAYHEV